MFTYSLGGGYLFTLRGVFHILLLMYVCTYLMFGHYVFFYVFVERAHKIKAAHYQKKMFFFCPARALDCCRFPKKNQFVLEIKKQSETKQGNFKR